MAFNNDPPQISISDQNDQVVIEFDKPTQWVGLTPQNAVAFAEQIVRTAMRLGEAQGSNLILPPGVHH